MGELTVNNRVVNGVLCESTIPRSEYLYAPEYEAILKKKIPYYIESLSLNSRSAFRSDMGIFVNWCKENNVCAIPVHPEVLRLFLIEQSHNHAPTSIERRLSTICKIHTILGLKSPRNEAEIKSVLKRIRMESGHKIKQAQPMRYRHLTILPSLINKESIKDIRDISIAFTAHSTLLRISEVSDILFEDVEFDEEEGDGIIVVRNIKGQKDSAEEHMAYLTPMATYWLKRWIKVADITDGYLFRSLSRYHTVQPRKLSSRYIADAMTRMGKLIDPDYCFTGHSTRVGAAQDMIANNIETTKAMNAGRWKDHKTFIRYVSKLNAKENGMAEFAKKVGGM